MREKLEPLLANENVQKYLKGIRDAEGTSKHKDPYRVAGGGKVTLTDLSKYDPVSWGFTETTGKKNSSTAAGAYQFLEGTWAEASKALKSQSFDRKEQDLGALYLMRQTGSIDDVVRGDFRAATMKDNKKWASLPGSPYPQAKRSMAYMEKAWGIAPEPTSREQQLAPFKLPAAPMVAEAPQPQLSQEQQRRMARILENPDNTPHQSRLASVAMRLPEEPVPDLFGTDLPTTFDSELLKLIETA